MAESFLNALLTARFNSLFVVSQSNQKVTAYMNDTQFIKCN